MRPPYRRTVAGLIREWGDLRSDTNEALKLLGMLPNAIACKDEDHFLDEVIQRLSTALVCIDVALGDEPPVDDLTEAE